MVSKVKSKPGVVAFFSVTLVFLVTAIITTPCPVCNGTGTVSSTPGTENVSIEDFEYMEKKVVRDSCGVYNLFTYEISMSLLNAGNQDVNAWFQFVLIDTFKKEPNNVIDIQYTQIFLPAGQVVNNSIDIVFGTGMDAPSRAAVEAQVVVGGVPDATCNGTGKIPINTWPLVNTLKDSFTEIVREVNPYHPPVAIDWAEYMEMFFNQ
jgi:hypothetical protein